MSFRNDSLSERKKHHSPSPTVDNPEKPFHEHDSDPKEEAIWMGETDVIPSRSQPEKIEVIPQQIEPPDIIKNQMTLNGKLVADSQLANIKKKCTQPGKYKKGEESGCDYSIVVITMGKGILSYYAIATEIGQGGFGKVRIMQNIDDGTFAVSKLLLLGEEESFNAREVKMLKQANQLIGIPFIRELKQAHLLKEKNRTHIYMQLKEFQESNKATLWTKDEEKTGIRILKHKNESLKFLEKKAKYRGGNTEYYLIGKGCFKGPKIKPVLKLTPVYAAGQKDEWFEYNKNTNQLTKKILAEYSLPTRQAFIVMKFIRGEEAAKYDARMKQEKNERHPSKDFLYAIVKAVKEGTIDKDIVHRDIKLQNIMYDPKTSTAAVIDYGTSMLATEMRYTLLGSPSFMAPEIFKSDKEREEKGNKVLVPSSQLYSEKTDVYALGIALAISLEMQTTSKMNKAEKEEKFSKEILSHPRFHRKTQVIDHLENYNPKGELALCSEELRNGMLKYLQKMTKLSPDDRPTLAEVCTQFLLFKNEMAQQVAASEAMEFERLQREGNTRDWYGHPLAFLTSHQPLSPDVKAPAVGGSEDIRDKLADSRGDYISSSPLESYSSASPDMKEAASVDDANPLLIRKKLLNAVLIRMIQGYTGHVQRIQAVRDCRDSIARLKTFNPAEERKRNVPGTLTYSLILLHHEFVRLDGARKWSRLWKDPSIVEINIINNLVYIITPEEKNIPTVFFLKRLASQCYLDGVSDAGNIICEYARIPKIDSQLEVLKNKLLKIANQKVTNALDQFIQTQTKGFWASRS